MASYTDRKVELDGVVRNQQDLIVAQPAVEPQGRAAGPSEYLDMKRGTVALRNDREVSIISAFGMSEEEIGRGRYRLGRGIIGKVAKRRLPDRHPEYRRRTVLPRQDRRAQSDPEGEHRLSLRPHQVQTGDDSAS
ncbi:MAG: hypothetical protein MZV70_13380 [Desulfobacterales bacterium]|nr:hypothetical protein [Desulfobacterales bacterium]